MNYNFAARVAGMKSSAIREILKVTESPEIISFAGGLPAPELFPLEEIRKSYAGVLGNNDPAALQYSTTEGYRPLREYIAAAMAEKGIKTGPDEILLTNGSQQALDLLAKLFIDPGDAIVVESPSYLGAIQVFRSYQARFVTVPAGPDGTDPEALEKALLETRPKLIYLTPTFNNPTGITTSVEKRRAIAKLAGKYQVPLIEDDPYGELRYRGAPVPSIKSMDRSGMVIYTSTFSKTVAPGLRIGWVTAEPDIMSKLVLAKQGADLHTGTLTQQALYNYLTNSNVTRHIASIRTAYGKRRDAMIIALKNTFPPGIQWTEPEGGMFLWITLPGHLDATVLLKEAITRKVAYVPGEPFFPDGRGANCLRLNFSNSTPSRIGEGISRLAGVFKT